MSKNLGNPSSMWNTSKQFVNWKSPGSPSQLEVNNELVTSASKIAEYMNNFFIDKVTEIISKRRNVSPNLNHCTTAMENRK